MYSVLSLAKELCFLFTMCRRIFVLHVPSQKGTQFISSKMPTKFGGFGIIFMVPVKEQPVRFFF